MNEVYYLAMLYPVTWLALYIMALLYQYKVIDYDIRDDFPLMFFLIILPMIMIPLMIIMYLIVYACIGIDRITKVLIYKITGKQISR